MGFFQGRKKGVRTPASHWWVPSVIAVIACLIALGQDDLRELLRYDRVAIEAGEAWRLFSGHFAHLTISHLGLNLAGLFLVWAIVGSRLTAGTWVVAVLLVLVGMDLGFWFLDTNLVWYVGLSGLLHGILIAGIVVAPQQQRGESLVILLLVFGKIVYEQLIGPLPGSEVSSGGSVVVNAHLFGAVSGLLAGLGLGHRAGLRRSV